MKTIMYSVLFLFSVLTFGQNNNLSMFNNLIGKTWKAEGKWNNGDKFLQEIQINSSLNGSIIMTESIGFIDKDLTKLGLRNYGIRQFDKASNTVKFWEFDVFGGLTQGIVITARKNIIYHYNYGNLKVTDMWEFVDNSTYNFKVGEYKNGQWIKIFLETQFKEIKNGNR